MQDNYSSSTTSNVRIENGILVKTETKEEKREDKRKRDLTNLPETSKPSNITLPRITNEDYFNSDRPELMAKLYKRQGENLIGTNTGDTNTSKFTSSAVKDLSELMTEGLGARSATILLMNSEPLTTK